jgi:hypothetical protein
MASGGEPGAKRAKVDRMAVFMDKEFACRQCLWSRPGITTLLAMLKLIDECPRVALQVYREQADDTADRADIWTVTGPLAWLLILSITDKPPQTNPSEVLTLFHVFMADGFRLTLRGALADIFTQRGDEWFTPTEFLARIEHGALESDLRDLGIYKVPENLQTVNLSLGALTSFPSAALVAECTNTVSAEPRQCALLLRLLVRDKKHTLQLRDKRACAFLRRITGKDHCQSLAQMVICDGVAPPAVDGVETAMLALAFGATEEPVATFHVYDSTESVEMKATSF